MSAQDLRHPSRFDYARFMLEVDYDLFGQQYNALGGVATMHVSRDEWGKSHAVRCVGIGKSGKRMYTIDVWGPAAEVVWSLDMSVWGPRLLRIDHRQEISDERYELELDMIRDLTSKPYKRNVQLNNSRARTKEGDRDAGGRSGSIGSHGSARRLIVYKRGSEPAAVEIQLRGAALRKVLASAMAYRNDSSVNWDDRWTCVYQLCVDEMDKLEKEVWDAAGYTASTRVSITPEGEAALTQASLL